MTPQPQPHTGFPLKWAQKHSKRIENGRISLTTCIGLYLYQFSSVLHDIGLVLKLWVRDFWPTPQPVNTLTPNPQGIPQPVPLPNHHLPQQQWGDGRILYAHNFYLFSDLYWLPWVINSECQGNTHPSVAWNPRQRSLPSPPPLWGLAAGALQNNELGSRL
jgi:hypothetical protein